MDALLAAHGREITCEHVPRVAREARALARRYGVNPVQAETAALLHDIGGIFNCSEMVALFEALNLPIEDAERQVPMLLHAKLSVVLARELYGVTDQAVLDAVRCHTTLHAAPTQLELVVFLADKLEWDQGGIPPYRAALSAALEDGVAAGTRWMLTWMASPAARLLIPHPDLRAAWEYYGIGQPLSPPVSPGETAG